MEGNERTAESRKTRNDVNTRQTRFNNNRANKNKNIDDIRGIELENDLEDKASNVQSATDPNNDWESENREDVNEGEWTLATRKKKTKKNIGKKDNDLNCPKTKRKYVKSGLYSKKNAKNNSQSFNTDTQITVKHADERIQKDHTLINQTSEIEINNASRRHEALQTTYEKETLNTSLKTTNLNNNPNILNLKNSQKNKTNDLNKFSLDNRKNTNYKNNTEEISEKQINTFNEWENNLNKEKEYALSELKKLQIEQKRVTSLLLNCITKSKESTTESINKIREIEMSNENETTIKEKTDALVKMLYKNPELVNKMYDDTRDKIGHAKPNTNEIEMRDTQPKAAPKRKKPDDSQDDIEEIVKKHFLFEYKANSRINAKYHDSLLLAREIQKSKKICGFKAAGIDGNKLWIETDDENDVDELNQDWTNLVGQETLKLDKIIHKTPRLNWLAVTIQTRNGKIDDNRENRNEISKAGLNTIQWQRSYYNGNLYKASVLNKEEYDKLLEAGSIKIGHIVGKVSPWRHKPRIGPCLNCFRYGHYKKDCGNQKVCPICGKLESMHQGECKSRPTCLNCKNAHRADSRDCPVYLKKKQEAMNKHNQKYNIENEEVIIIDQTNQDKNLNSKTDTKQLTELMITHMEKQDKLMSDLITTIHEDEELNSERFAAMLVLMENHIVTNKEDFNEMANKIVDKVVLEKKTKLNNITID